MMNWVKGMLNRILQEKGITNTMFIVTIVLLFNYRYSMKMLNVDTINIGYEGIYLILILLVVLFEKHKGDKVIYIGVNLCSIATILFVSVHTLKIHVATMGKVTLFLEYHPLRIILMFMYAMLLWIQIKIFLDILLKLDNEI